MYEDFGPKEALQNEVPDSSQAFLEELSRAKPEQAPFFDRPVTSKLATGDEYVNDNNVIRKVPGYPIPYPVPTGMLYQQHESLKSPAGDLLSVDTTHDYTEPFLGEPAKEEHRYRYRLESGGLSINGDSSSDKITVSKDGKAQELSIDGDGATVQLPDGRTVHVQRKDGVTTMTYSNGDEIHIDRQGIKSVTRTVGDMQLTVGRDDLPKSIPTKVHLPQ